MITQPKRSSSGPSPELAQAKWTKIAFIDEPEDNRALLPGQIKRWTGGDSFFARFCNQDGGKIEVTYKTVLTCNKIPLFPAVEKSLVNRVGVLPYDSTWVDCPPETVEEQYKQRKFRKDPQFENQIPGMAAAFLWVATQYYPKYMEEGLKAPQAVKTRTEEYWTSSDVYGKFISACLTKSKDEKSFITTVQVNRVFGNWFSIAYPSKKERPDMDTLIVEISNRLKTQPITSCWYGWRIVYDAGDNSSPFG
jgi:phage/plasmid-associated DNA primase